MASINISDKEIRKAIDEMFIKYDLNKDSRLSFNELLPLFKDTMSYLNKGGEVSNEVVKEFIREADMNKDKEVDKEEMFVVFQNVV